jgi:uncharacterized spore protein YtfJ
MDMEQMMAGARDALTVGRVFGEPYERDGVTVIPAARIQGGGGGGSGDGVDRGAPSGSGGGFGLTARPAGVFVVAGGKVRWEPALDINRIVLGAQVVAVVGLLVARAIVKTKAKQERQR